ncbi:hypothetical protein BOTBODRAFT_180240 [Botryobasidium botryosum FD-172 SS1]|uniref:SAM domain-containing protein n=1 Tax=Botryobasidium botryosum (strain FD-172 SS1) TaxID=930990 RepID=A0A067M8U4_BOTB1|nr:hypothetical protein BOTBODRAFT_180240 [Botryobasidium botryosum FD-172 SS1]
MFAKLALAAVFAAAANFSLPLTVDYNNIPSPAPSITVSSLFSIAIPERVELHLLSSLHVVFPVPPTPAAPASPIAPLFTTIAGGNVTEATISLTSLEPVSASKSVEEWILALSVQPNFHPTFQPAVQSVPCSEPAPAPNEIIIWDFRMHDPAYIGHWKAYGQLGLDDSVPMDQLRVGNMKITVIERRGPLSVGEILAIAFSTLCVVHLLVSLIGCAVGIALSIIALPLEVAGWLLWAVWLAFAIVRWFASATGFKFAVSLLVRASVRVIVTVLSLAYIVSAPSWLHLVTAFARGARRPARVCFHLEAARRQADLIDEHLNAVDNAPPGEGDENVPTDSVELALVQITEDATALEATVLGSTRIDEPEVADLHPGEFLLRVPRAILSGSQVVFEAELGIDRTTGILSVRDASFGTLDGIATARVTLVLDDSLNTVLDQATDTRQIGQVGCTRASESKLAIARTIRAAPPTFSSTVSPAGAPQSAGLIEDPASAAVSVISAMVFPVVFGPPLPPRTVAVHMFCAALHLVGRYRLRYPAMFKSPSSNPFLALLPLVLPKPVAPAAEPFYASAEPIPERAVPPSFASATVPGVGEEIPLSWLVELATLPTIANLQLQEIQVDTHKATRLDPRSGWVLYQCKAPREFPHLALVDWWRLVMFNDEELISRGVTDLRVRRLMLRGFWGVRKELGMCHPNGLWLPPALDVRPFIGLLGDLPSWLRAWSLHPHKEKFSGMEWPELSGLTEKDFLDRGIPHGAKDRFLYAIREAKKELLRLAASVPPLPSPSAAPSDEFEEPSLSSSSSCADSLSLAPIAHEFPSVPPPKVRGMSFANVSRLDAIGPLSASISAPSILSLRL